MSGLENPRLDLNEIKTYVEGLSRNVGSYAVSQIDIPRFVLKLRALQSRGQASQKLETKRADSQEFALYAYFIDQFSQYEAKDAKRLYRSLALAWHPDKQSDPFLCKAFAQMSDAYALVSSDKSAEPQAAPHPGLDPNFGIHDLLKVDPNRELLTRPPSDSRKLSALASIRELFIAQVEEQIQSLEPGSAQYAERYRCWFNLHLTESSVFLEEPILLGRLLQRFKPDMPQEIKLAITTYVINYFKKQLFSAFPRVDLHLALGIPANIYAILQDGTWEDNADEFSEAVKTKLKRAFLTIDPGVGEPTDNDLWGICQTLHAVLGKLNREPQADLEFRPDERPVFIKLAKAVYHSYQQRPEQPQHHQALWYQSDILLDQLAEWWDLQRSLLAAGPSPRIAAPSSIQTPCFADLMISSQAQIEPQQPQSLRNFQIESAQLTANLGNAVSVRSAIVHDFLSLMGPSGVTTARELKKRLRLLIDGSSGVVEGFLEHIETYPPFPGMQFGEVKRDTLLYLVAELESRLGYIIDRCIRLKPEAHKREVRAQLRALAQEADEYLSKLADILCLPEGSHSSQADFSYQSYESYIKKLGQSFDQVAARSTDYSKTPIDQFELDRIDRTYPYTAEYDTSSKEYHLLLSAKQLRDSLKSAIIVLFKLRQSLESSSNPELVERRRIYEKACREYLKVYREIAEFTVPKPRNLLRPAGDLTRFAARLNEITESELINNQAHHSKNRSAIRKVGYGLLCLITVFALAVAVAIYDRFFSSAALTKKETRLAVGHVGAGLLETTKFQETRAQRERRAGLPDQAPQYATLLYCREKNLLNPSCSAPGASSIPVY